jgi:hypothetical protein
MLGAMRLLPLGYQLYSKKAHSEQYHILSSLQVATSIDISCNTAAETPHPNKGKPAVMLGRKAYGPGPDQDSVVAR